MNKEKILKEKHSRLWKWFDNDCIEDALIGENLFFIPEHSYREDHDTSLVMYQLLIWAEYYNKPDVVAKYVQNTIKKLISVDNIIKAIDIMRSFFILKPYSNINIPINISEIINDLLKSIQCRDTDSQTSDLYSIMNQLIEEYEESIGDVGDILT